MSNTEDLHQKLKGLKSEHQNLDHTLLSMSNDVHLNMLEMQRLKKRKLQLRDQILWIENTIHPNIIA